MTNARLCRVILPVTLIDAAASCYSTRLDAPGMRVLPYGNVELALPRQARSHSVFEHNRLPERMHASAACVPEMCPCGTAPRTEIARALDCAPGDTYGEIEIGPAKPSITSDAS